MLWWWYIANADGNKRQWRFTSLLSAKKQVLKLKRKRNAAILLKKWLIFQVEADSIFAVCPSIIIVLGRQLRTPSTYYWTIFTNRISSTNILMMTGSSCSSSSTKMVLLVVPGFPSFFVHFWLSTYDCRLVQNYQLPSGSVKLIVCNPSSFVLHSPFPFPQMLQRKKKLKATTRRGRRRQNISKVLPK